MGTLPVARGDGHRTVDNDGRPALRQPASGQEILVMQPGGPAQDPYRQQPPAPDQPPYGQPPYGRPPHLDPYGRPAPGPPYGPVPGQPDASYAPPAAYPPAAYPPASGRYDPLGLIGMILGILSIVPGACCPLLGIPLGVAAVALGAVGRGRVSQGLASNSGQALAAVLLGIVGALLSMLRIVLSLALDLGSPFSVG